MKYYRWMLFRSLQMLKKFWGWPGLRSLWTAEFEIKLLTSFYLVLVVHSMVTLDQEKNWCFGDLLWKVHQKHWYVLKGQNDMMPAYIVSYIFFQMHFHIWLQIYLIILILHIIFQKYLPFNYLIKSAFRSSLRGRRHTFLNT